MNDSTKRTIRTVVHVTLALCAAIAIAVPIFSQAFAPLAAVGAVALTFVGAVAKAWNALEDKGLIPAWLKDTATPAEPAPTEPAPPSA